MSTGLDTNYRVTMPVNLTIAAPGALWLLTMPSNALGIISEVRMGQKVTLANSQTADFVLDRASTTDAGNADNSTGLVVPAMPGAPTFAGGGSAFLTYNGTAWSPGVGSRVWQSAGANAAGGWHEVSQVADPIIVGPSQNLAFRLNSGLAGGESLTVVGTIKLGLIFW